MARRRRSDNTGSIFKDKNGYWNAQVFVGYTNEGKRKCLRKRAKIEAEVVTWLNAQLAQSPQTAPEQLTVRQFIERWLEQVKRSDSYGTWETYHLTCHKHVLGRLGKIMLRKLTQAQCQNLLNTLHDTGLSYNTLSKIKSMLQRAFKDAQTEKLITSNPMTGAKLPNQDRASAFEAQAFTAEQSQHFLASVENHRNKALFWVALMTGLRKGELIALRIEDVDLEAQTLRVAASARLEKGKGMVRKSTKNKASEDRIPLPDMLIPIIREHLIILAEERTDYRWTERGLLFPNERGQLMSSSTLWCTFKKALKDAELPPIRFHDLRHSCATLLITLGVHPRVIMEILRHAQISTTMNKYGHVIPEVNRAAINQLSELIAPLTLEIPAKKIPS